MHPSAPGEGGRTPVSAPSSAKAQAREKVRGLWIAIPTPFTADGRRVDEDLLAASVEHYVGGLRVDGIFCGGVMGEFWALSLEERERVHELVVRQAGGRVPVMAHVGHHVLSDAVELSEHALESGVHFGIAMNPYYPPSPPPESVRAWYEALAERSSLPMFLFNTTYAGYALAPEQIAELAELENLCGMKNPQSREHLLRVQALTGDRIVVTDASERDWLELHTEHGFQALMSTPALALYQRPGDLPIVDYTRLADSGDLAGARALSDRLGPARDAFDRWMRAPWLERHVIPIAQLKAWLGLLGLPQGPVRPPLVPLTREELLALRRELEAAGLL
ncbi:MAG TPA: dihydrodipicolinate synthase family protein [Thermoleophilaceae bacterium]|nr:dihydrodipicolinate synthase family protein [Thermoleophilaceae bacterium]